MGLLLVAYLGSFLVGGERSVSGVGLPSSVEWVVLGIVLGPRALGVVPSSLVSTVEPVIAVALAWLMLSTGAHYAMTSRGYVHFARILLALASALVAAGAVFAAVYFGVAHVAPELAKDRLVLALALAAVSCETTRLVMRWVRERYGATGPVTEWLEDVAGADDLVPIGLLVAIFAIAGKSKLAALGAPAVSGITVGMGALLGYMCALLLGREFRLRESWGTVLGISMLGIGVSAMLGLAYVVVLFVMGIVLVLASHHRHEIRAMLAPTERGALLPLLIVCGVRIEPQNIGHTVAVFGLVFGARVVVKVLVARVFTAFDRDAASTGNVLGLATLSSGTLTMCIGLVCVITFPGAVGSTVLAVSAALCVAGELIGPPALRVALRRAGELHSPEAREAAAADAEPKHETEPT